MSFLKRIYRILSNPLIWLYFISTIIIFLISVNVFAVNNMLILYLLISLAGVITIVGICTNPCCINNKQKTIKNKQEDINNERKA